MTTKTSQSINAVVLESSLALKVLFSSGELGLSAPCHYIFEHELERKMSALEPRFLSMLEYPFGTFICVLEVGMHLLYSQMCSRSTPVDPNAFSTCSSVLSLDARRSKCVSHVLKCALARRLSIEMRFLCLKCAPFLMSNTTSIMV